MLSTPHAVIAARGLLSDVTPLKGDCGRLCGAACCQGDAQTGMLLFPGEEGLYEGCAFARVIPARYALAGRRAQLLVCAGSCSRADRPLACRLFPLFLRFDRGASPRVVMDARAGGLCPLCGYGLSALDPAFLKAARGAYALLLEDAACRAYLEALSAAFTL